MKDTTSSGWWRALGPGLLYAAAAIGVSHLVQSTRAGALYGIALAGFIILANVAKYPAFRFAPQYTLATGRSLLQGYRRQGRWTLAVTGALTLGTMFTVQAAVGAVTAGLFLAVTGIEGDVVVVAAGLLLAGAALLALGDYRWLDRVTKVLVALLTVATLSATVLAAARFDWANASWAIPLDGYDRAMIVFLAGLVGWMPAPIDLAVWQSLWTKEKARAQERFSMRVALLDFHIGYLGTAVLALCFMLMGAGVMFGSGAVFADSAGAFAAQVINLYGEVLGDWSRPVVGLAAFAVMFSTTLTVLDGFPRALSALWARWNTDEPLDRSDEDRRAYWICLALLVCGACVVLAKFLTSLKGMVQVATTLSFLTSPVLAIFNHRAMTSSDVPEEHRPSAALQLWSILGVVFLVGFALYYGWILVSAP